MLNLKAEAVDRFEEWKAELAEVLHTYIDTIEMAVPDKYEKNKVYKQLKNAMNEIYSFEITTVHSASWQGIKFKDNFELAYHLGCYKNRIKELLPKNISNHLYEPIDEKLGELLSIFTSK